MEETWRVAGRLRRSFFFGLFSLFSLFLLFGFLFHFLFIFFFLFLFAFFSLVRVEEFERSSV